MEKLKIPENHSGISKTLRLPENIVDDIQNLANLKNLSFNKIVVSLLLVKPLSLASKLNLAL